MDWGGDVEMYSGFQDFANRFLLSLESSRIRVLKQNRGNGGNGVFKVCMDNIEPTTVRIIQARVPDDMMPLLWDADFSLIMPTPDTLRQIYLV